MNPYEVLGIQPGASPDDIECLICKRELPFGEAACHCSICGCDMPADARWTRVCDECDLNDHRWLTILRSKKRRDRVFAAREKLL